MQTANQNSYWKVKTKIERTYPYLTSDMSCDVAIVGGGITGAITAFFLAKEGLNIAVFDKNIVGYGNTILSTAMMGYDLDVNMTRLEKIVGKEKSQKIYHWCMEAIQKIENMVQEVNQDVGFERQDVMYYSNKFMQKSNMAKEYHLRKEAGFDTLFLERHNLVNLNSAILTKNAGAVMDPYKFTQEIFRYLDKLNNVRIFENTQIEEIVPKYNKVECVTNNFFHIEANSVIVTCGIQSLKIIPLPVELYQKFTVVTKPLPKLKEANIRFCAKDTVEPYHNVRFTPSGRIIFSGEDLKINDRKLDDKYLRLVAKDRYKKLSNILFKTFNLTEQADIDYCFNGVYANTKDTLPVIDELPNMPNCFCNLCLGTNGILYSVIGANILKDAVKGFYTKDMYLFKMNR